MRRLLIAAAALVAVSCAQTVNVEQEKTALMARDAEWATTPANIDSVSFTLAPVGAAGAPTTVQAKLVSTSTTYSTCTLASATWTCNVTGVTALAADELRVIAAQ